MKNSWKYRFWLNSILILLLLVLVNDVISEPKHSSSENIIIPNTNINSSVIALKPINTNPIGLNSTQQASSSLNKNVTSWIINTSHQTDDDGANNSSYLLLHSSSSSSSSISSKVAYSSKHRYTKDLTSPGAGGSISWFSSYFSIFLVVFVLALFILIILYCIIRCCSNKDKDKSTIKNDWKNTNRPVALFPTAPNDPYLTSQQEPESGSAVRLNNVGLPYYYLEPQITMVKVQTGQLFHPPSGLLFNLINGYVFDHTSGYMVDLVRRSCMPVNTNLVYHPPTKRVYERCISMRSKTAGLWSLVKSPVVANMSSLSTFNPIRRARSDELPAKLSDHYMDMLSQWKRDQAMLKNQRNSTHIQAETGMEFHRQSTTSNQSAAQAHPISAPPVLVVVNNGGAVTPSNNNSVWSKRGDNSPNFQSRGGGKYDRFHLVAPSMQPPRRIQIAEEKSNYEDAISNLIFL